MHKRPQPTLLKRQLWLLDPEAMRDGDVLLEFGDTVFSWIISAVDRSRFSHALIWAGNSDFVESVGSGVRILSYARVVISDPAKWHLRRHADSEVARTAAEAARRMVGKHYNSHGAVRSVLPGSGESDPEALFCSELIAEAYADAGRVLVPGLPPNKVTPRMLLQCEELIDAPIPLVECNEQELARALKLEDREKAFAGSLMEMEAHAARKAFDAVKPLINTLPLVSDRRIKEPPGNLHELIDKLASVPSDASRALMDQLLTQLLNVKYFHLLDEPAEEVRSAIVSVAVRIRFHQMPPEEMAGLRKDVANRGREYGVTAQRHLRNAEICETLAARSPHRLWDELSAMYRRNYQQMLILRTLAIEVSTN